MTVEPVDKETFPVRVVFAPITIDPKIFFKKYFIMKSDKAIENIFFIFGFLSIFGIYF